jgi:putative FmdB family regulatory protein
MPLVEYVCSSCEHKESSLVKNKDLKSIKGRKKCPKCQKEDVFVRQLKSPTSNSKMVIDNGNMPRAIEVLRNVEEIRDAIKQEIIPKGE